jgi:hypothetical protein
MFGPSIGLYGDSFGTGSLPKIDGNYDIGFNYHWSKIIENQYSCKITNYCESGASVYYAYKKFIETHHLHDINIFLVTTFGRYSHEINLEINGKHRIVNLAHLLTYFDYKNLTKKDIELLNNLKGWYTCIDDTEQKDIEELMVEKVLKLRPDTIHIPCMNWLSNKYSLCNNPKMTLFELYVNQQQQLNLNNINVKENTRWISGHFTPEFNQLFASFLQTKIDTGYWETWNIPKIQFGPDVKEYFIST